MEEHLVPLTTAAMYDLSVPLLSPSLENVKVDLVVTGSIAAVQSLHLIRSLRRLGAEVQVILSKGGELFIGKTALEWASGSAVITDFCGHISHLAGGDLCVIAPASANFLARLKSGFTDDPASARVQSYLGSAPHRVIAVPCMHDSLLASPFTSKNLSELKPHLTLLWGEAAEGKRKFPNPDTLADDISHHYNSLAKSDPVLVIMGSTRSYLDDVRFMQSYSSGALGSEVAEELHRHGMKVHVITGDTRQKPRNVTSQEALSHQDMLSAAQKSLGERPAHIIMLASVLDYVCQEKQPGKISSGKKDLTVSLTPTSKIRSQINSDYRKICFKLEPHQPSASWQHSLLEKWSTHDGVDMVVVNALEHMQNGNYQAHCLHYETTEPTSSPKMKEISSKRALAQYLRMYLKNQLP